MASVLLASRLVLTKEENMLLFVCSEAVESKLVELETRRIAENAHHRMEYHCTSDVLFYLFTFGWLAYFELATDLLVWSNPNKSNRRPGEILPLMK